MKKLFVALLAVAGLTACFNEEVVNVADQRTPIAFDSFTDKVTRVDDPSSTTANLEEFYVWGVMDEADGVVFDDETVSGGVGAWTYAQQQYWTPGHKYYFAAFAGDRSNDQIVFKYANAAKEGMSLDGLGTATFKNVAGINDFLYAEQTATTPAVIDSEDDVQKVNFAFDHLLSKVKFTFKNGFINDNITVLVKNVKMEVPAQGTIDLTANAYNWTNLEGTTILDMGDMAAGAKIAINDTASSDNERLTIPAAASQVYTVTFYVESWQGDVLSTSATKVVEITNCVLEPGKAYNFVATLDHTNVAENPLFPIVFDCTVDEWDTEVEYNGGVIETKNYAAVVAEALAAGGEVTLSQDVALTKPLVVPVGVNATINLNGFDITAALQEKGRHHYAIDNYGTLTLAGEGAINARGIENFGTMTINGNITITNVDTNGGSAIWNEGDLVINGGTFTTNAQAGAGSYGGALYTVEGHSAVINCGTFISNSQLTYAILNYGETIINDAVVKGKHGAVGAASDADTVINGGSFELMENPSVSDHCTYYVSDIKGGKFTLGKNTDSGALVFYESTIVAGYKAVANGDWFEVVAE